MECPFCGCELPLNVEFCPDCGYEVDAFFLAEQVLESRLRMRTFDSPKDGNHYSCGGGNGRRRKKSKSKRDFFGIWKMRVNSGSSNRHLKSSPGWK